MLSLSEFEDGMFAASNSFYLRLYTLFTIALVTPSKNLILLIAYIDTSILDYQMLNLEIPTISLVGSLVKAGIPVLVYR